MNIFSEEERRLSDEALARGRKLIMRDRERILRMEDKLIVLWLRYPDMRFGQFVYNLYREYVLTTESYWMSTAIDDAIWKTEDDVFERFLDKQIEMG